MIHSDDIANFWLKANGLDQEFIVLLVKDRQYPNSVGTNMLFQLDEDGDPVPVLDLENGEWVMTNLRAYFEMGAAK
jgi:hypothetical protein